MTNILTPKFAFAFFLKVFKFAGMPFPFTQK